MKTLVIKIGGSVLKSKTQIEAIAAQVAKLNDRGYRLAIVHGGGPHINSHLLVQGVSPVFVEGQRITDDETLMAVFAALGQINNELVSALKAHDVSAAGLHAEPNLFRCRKKLVKTDGGKSIDLGWVGEITQTSVETLTTYPGSVLVVSPIGWDGNYNRYNINADNAAFALATTLQADSLIFVSDVPGVMTDETNRDSVAPVIDSKTADLLINQGKITGGMIPKLRNSQSALASGVGNVSIIDGQANDSLMRAVEIAGTVGTTIILQSSTGSHIYTPVSEPYTSHLFPGPVTKAS